MADMTDINDDYSPHDAADEARAEDPPDGYGQRQPLDLDDLQKLYDLAAEPGGLPSWGRIVYLRVPELIAELREARERIAELEALPTREEWAVTESEATPPRPETVGVFTAEGAMRAVANHGVQAWRRVRTADPVVIRDWEPISPKAPF